jgi:hypothetical protein
MRSVTRVLSAFGLAIVCFPSPAQAWIDGCPADQNVFAQSGGYYYLSSQDASYAFRQGCPWYVIDVSNARGKRLFFEGLWGFGVLPQNQADCVSSEVSWGVGFKISPVEYAHVDQGTARGQWAQKRGFGVCTYRITSGHTAFVPNAPYDQYRMIVKASGSWGPAAVTGHVTAN